MVNNSQITVIGLGNMGSAIAKAFLERGYRTTVWNRTARKAEPIAEDGATVASSAADAVAASPLVVVCLIDGDAVHEVFDSIGHAVNGKVLVNLTSGSPQQARTSQGWAHEHGAQYIDGGVMGDPPDVGTPTMMIAYSGDRVAFDACRHMLDELGTIAYYGEDAGLAAVEFMAQLAVAYELLIGLLHTIRLVRAEGVDVVAFTRRIADSISGYAPIVTTFGTAIASEQYAPDLGPINVQAALMDDMISHRESLGVDTHRMRASSVHVTTTRQPERVAVLVAGDALGVDM